MKSEEAASSEDLAQRRRPRSWAVAVIGMVIVVAAAVGAIRWNEHARNVDRLQSSARGAARIASSYRVLVDRIEAKRRLGNHLLERLGAAQYRARDAPIGAVAIIRDRLDALRRGDRFDDIVAYARANLPSSDQRALDSDFSVLLKRQEDAADAIQVVSSTLQELLANPMSRIGFTESDGKKMWKSYHSAENAFAKAFEKMQRGVYRRAGAAELRARQAKASADASRNSSFLQAVLSP